MVLSKEAVTIRLLSGEKATDWTWSACTSKIATFCPVLKSPISTSLIFSTQPAIHCPLGETAAVLLLGVKTIVTAAVVFHCGFTYIRAPVSASQTLTPS